MSAHRQALRAGVAANRRILFGSAIVDG